LTVYPSRIRWCFLSVQFSHATARLSPFTILKLPWADRLLILIDTLKIERDNEEKRRKRKNEGINKRIKTLIIKVYEIRKFDGVDVALTIYKHSRYTTYNSKVYISWPPFIIEIVSKATICLNTRVLILYF